MSNDEPNATAYSLSHEMLACPLKMPSSPLVFMSLRMGPGVHAQQHASALTADGSMEFNMPMISGDDFFTLFHLRPELPRLPCD